MASPRVLSPRLNDYHQSWSFSTAMLEAQQKDEQLPSDPPSPDLLSSTSEDQIRIPHRSRPKDMRAFQQIPAPSAVLNDRYLSSEEQLSPAENESSSSSSADEELEEFLDDDDDQWLDELLADFTCKMATAICFMQVGKPKVVEIPVPSLTSSPSLSSDSERIPSHVFIPPRPRTPVRRRPIGPQYTAAMPTRPALPTLTSSSISTTFTNASTPSVGVETYQPKPSPESTSSSPKQPVETYIPLAPTFLNTDPFAKPAPQSATEHPPRTSSNHSRLRNLSQKLARFTNTSKVDLTDGAVHSGPHKRKDSVASFHDPSDILPRTRSISISTSPKMFDRLKMVPRGAAERAPPIEIPPCPEHIDLDLNFDGPQEPPQRLRRRKSSLLISKLTSRVES
jgi:hypothetical protein